MADMVKRSSFLENEVVENDFGLKVVLNTISHDNLRKIIKTNIVIRNMPKNIFHWTLMPRDLLFFLF